MVSFKASFRECNVGEGGLDAAAALLLLVVDTGVVG